MALTWNGPTQMAQPEMVQPKMAQPEMAQPEMATTWNGHNLK